MLTNAVTWFQLSATIFYQKLEINKPQYLETLSFVSFFSDITLKTRTQIEINNQSDLDSADLDDEDKLAVLYHARDAAKIIKEHHTAPQGIEQIILKLMETLTALDLMIILPKKFTTYPKYLLSQILL